MILVENRIEVRAGFGEAVLERFRTPKTVHTFPGFVRMDVLHTTNGEGNEEIRVCTTWEKEADFHAWANSDSFRHAHARRAEAAASAEQAEAQPSSTPAAHSHGAPETGAASDAQNNHPSGEAAAANGPIVGNKVTIYQVVVSHLPEPAAAAPAH
ncbi:antibiotic biosynthesis monooxygenase [Paenibacillus baekrokdamisoli]|nr:antibiotic biosynthesis monooxygenase [Paenibacillus baekrokdamisoli]